LPSAQRKIGLPNINEYEEASASSANDWYAGDLVRLDSSGELVIATAGHILGIALKAASGTASTKIPVDVLTDQDQVSVVCNTTTAESDLGATFDFTFTAGAHVATAGGTTDSYCVAHDSINAVGTDGGRLIVRMLPGALIMR